MKLNKYKFIGIALIALLGLTYCSSPKKAIESEQYIDNKSDGIELTITGIIGKGHNHPSFVIWQEDMNGAFIKTIFITKSYATGIFGHENIGDTAWHNHAGRSIQPSALPYWTYKKGEINGVTNIPTPENPYVDAFTGATPKADFSIKTRINADQNFRVLMEVNQAWDWNDYWTNDKFPGSESYKHSAQPSLVYAVTLNNSDSSFYLNPIGHGDPQGLSGKLYTNISTFTTAKEIFKEIKIIRRD